jgi:hypothetical protein
MADTKLSALTELNATPAGADEIYIRDVSESASAESKRITVTNLVAAAGGVSLSGSTNNTVATVTGANALIGEANLTFSGCDLKLSKTGAPEFHLEGTTIPRLFVTAYAASACGGGNAPEITLRRSDNATLGCHAAVDCGENLGYLSFQGSDGDSYHTATYIKGLAAQDWSNTNYGGELQFYTTANCAADPSLRMSIDHSGDIDFQNNDLLNVGAAGNDWTSTLMTITGSGAHTIERTLTADNVISVLTLAHKANTNSTDGSGPRLDFSWQDNGAGPTVLGNVSVQRIGGDTTGRFKIDLNNAGTSNNALLLTAPGVLSVDLAGSGSAAQVDLFDDYCDPVEIQRYAHTMGALVTPEQQEINRQRMLELGIIDKKDTGSGYMLNLQPLTRLLAGGIYQNAARITALEAKLEARLNG